MRPPAFGFRPLPSPPSSTSQVVWARVGPILGEWQEAAASQAVWENVEWLGRRYEAWLETVWKPKLEAVPPGGR